MSYSTFYLLPADPHYVPSAAQQRAFEELFMKVLGVADDHYRCLTELPMMVGHEETSWVRCPACGATLRMFTQDYEPTAHYEWHKRLRELPAFAPCRMPCCGAEARPIELAALPQPAYARFARGALNPQVADYWDEEGLRLKPEWARRFEEALGAPVLQHWVAGT